MSKTSGLLGVLGISICLIAIMFKGASTEVLIPNQEPVVKIVAKVDRATITKIVDSDGVCYVATYGPNPPSLSCISRTK